MIRGAIALALSAASVGAFALAAGKPEGPAAIEVTYIANEGFLVEVGGRKILLDALFGPLEGNWADQPDPETAERLARAVPPFDDVDLVTVSHRHVDHFDPDLVVRHALRSPRARVLAPRQVEAILAEHPDYQKIRDRVVAVTPPPGEEVRLELAGIALRVLRLEHSPYPEIDPETGRTRNRHADVENLGLVLEVGDATIFHCGDTNPFDEAAYAGFALDEAGIDLAFLERMFLTGQDQPGVRVIERHLRPKRIVLMHIGPERRGAFRDLAAALADRLPAVHVFEEPGERALFPLE